MKIHLKSLLLPSLAAAVLSLATLGAAEDDAGSTVTAKLSAPGKPATLRIDMPWADIHIVGTDGDTVTVASTLSHQGEKREDGLRRLDDEVTFELTEHDNVVSLHLSGDNPAASQDAEFKISMPRAMALDVRTETGGDLTVGKIDGDIEINNMNGEVVLDDISGSTVVNTMNGEVHVTYAKAPQKLVSITSMNGEVDLRVPADTKANVRLRTHNGSILTDFDDNVLKTKTEGSSRSIHYSHTVSADASPEEIARAAAEGARQGLEIARQVVQEVSRTVKEEVERAQKEAAEEDAANAHSDIAPRPPRPPRAPRALPPITGGKIVSGTLNGGGVDIKVSSMNGEITLRQTHAPGSEGAKTESNISVQFKDPDSFTDVRENHSTLTSTDYLDSLRAYLQQTAAQFVGDNQRLAIVVTDIDLAGENLNNQPNQIRVMKDIYPPRVKLTFQLLDTHGKVLKEGERKLSDTNYLLAGGRPGSSEPLYYDKLLLKQWLQDEFRTKS